MWDKDGLGKALDREFGVRFDAAKVLEQDHTLDEKSLHARIVAEAEQEYEKKTAEIGPKLMHHIEKEIMLRQLDLHWKEHIGALDYLRQGIHLRGYAQRNPKQEYKREAFEMFSAHARAREARHDLDPVEDPDPAARGRAGDRARDARPADAPVPARGCAVARRAASAAEPVGPPGARATPGTPLPSRAARSPSRRTCASSRRSGATHRAHAARGRNSSSATAGSADT